eukprot:1585731-Rhodomonas_salina.1
MNFGSGRSTVYGPQSSAAGPQPARPPSASRPAFQQARQTAPPANRTESQIQEFPTFAMETPLVSQQASYWSFEGMGQGLLTFS